METYFSIYKLDIEFIWKDIIGKKDVIDLLVLCEFVIRDVKLKALVGDSNNENNVLESKNGNDFLLLYAKKNIPIWLRTIQSNFPDTESIRSEFVNQSTSFLMLSIIGNSVYATTGGYASSYIKRFIIRNFGLNLLTKLYEESDSVIQELTENYMVGSRQAVSAINRGNTNFNNEKDFSKIFKRISTQASHKLCKKLGILVQGSSEGDSKQYRIISTDALNIRKMMSITDYKNVLKKINEIDETPSKFALSYFVPISNSRVTSTKALESLCNKIFHEPGIVNEIQIVGDNHFDYLEAAKWELYNDDVFVKEKGDSAFTFQETFEIFKNNYKRDNLSLTAIKDFLNKWRISAYKNENELVINKERILDLIDFNFTHVFELEPENYSASQNINEELTVYLNSGSWYVLDTNYTKFIDESFERLIKKHDEEAKKLYSTHDLIRQCKNEHEYNISFCNKNKSVKNVIYADQTYLSKIEICDLIVFDADNTYLVCNKIKPTGSGSRDLLNQIHSSAKIIQNQPERLNEYYNQLIAKHRMVEDYISETEFCKKISEAKFISAYVCEDLTIESKSTYAKLLSVQTEKLLAKDGKELIVTSPQRYIT